MMKTRMNYFVPLFIFICMGFTVPNNYILKDYAVTIHGTSNHDDWDEVVGKVTGNGMVSKNKDESFDLNILYIKMDVRSITSKSTIMNNKTYSALKADRNPEINFRLISPIKAIKVSQSGTTMSAKGTLTIAGVTNAITMQVKVFMTSQEKLIFEGTQAIRMTDYEITPPTALFGALTTGNDITLHFKTSFVLIN